MNRRELLLAVGAVTLGGCATLRPGFVQPSVTLNSLRMLPEGGAGPRFALSLRIINPNRFELALRGLSYEVELDGFKLITGVTADVSPVPPYGESLVEVQSGVDLLAGAR